MGFIETEGPKKTLTVFNRRIRTVSMQSASTLRQMDRW